MGRKPKAYHHGDLRRTLVDAALALVARNGVSPLTLRAVARKAGVSPAAPYHHFADKSALLAAVAEEGFRALEVELRLAAARRRTPLGKVEAIGCGYVRFAVAHPAHFRVMFGAEVGARLAEPPLSEISVGTFELLVDAVRTALRAAGRPHAEPREPALLGWCAVHGLATLWLEGPLHRVGATDRSIDRLAERASAVFARAALT